MGRRIVALVCALALSLGLAGTAGAAEVEMDRLRALVVYAGDGEGWKDGYSHLEQSLLLNLQVEAKELGEDYDLGDYDLVYPDPSVKSAPRTQWEKLVREALPFVERGGAVFLENCFYNVFPKEFIGAEEFVPLDHCPVELTAGEEGEDLGELRSIVLDFVSLYPEYTDYERLSKYSYGYGVRPGTAQAVVLEGDLALYTMNQYGKGWVFFTNPLLPNAYSVNGFSLESRGEVQASLATSTAGANQLIRNAFAGFVSKKRFGYAPYRVFGVLGRPSMAWELHVEDITGMAESTATPFIQLCRENGQIPSFSLIRNAYYWVSRQESVSYALNLGQEGAMGFRMDYAESAYSSGTHVPTGGNDWVRLGDLENAGSYFMDYPEYDQRAYPWVGDLNGDGKADLVCGAADGNIYFYPGTGDKTRFAVGERTFLRDAANPLAAPGGGSPADSPMSVPGYSAPVVCDVDGDGRADILSGAADGKLYWFAGEGGMTFRTRGVLLDTGLSGQVFPDVGDWNGDGRLDLVVGSNAGVLRVYMGGSEKGLVLSSLRWQDLSEACEEIEGDWLAPRLADLNGDGVTDLAVGTFHGYVARLVRSWDGSAALEGYITGGEQNYKGNDYLKFGNNCVPFFADLDGDGNLDLVAGSLEYGMACPIDSPYFPYRKELQGAVKAILDQDCYLGLHYYTNVGASAQREAYELSAHKTALEAYGVDTSLMGCNQHTWHLSSESQTQSFEAMWEAGLLWNSGFEPARSAATPQVSAESVLSVPFFLEREGERTILLQNCSTLTYVNQPWDEIAARYGVPTCVYYHCDWLFKENIQAEAQEKIETLQAFWSKYQYNFVKEDQLMQATAAAYNLTLDCVRTEGSITLTPGEAGSDFPLYSEDYQKSCGVRLSFAEGVDPERVSTDAAVWCWVDGDLYLGLNAPVKVTLESGRNDGGHLERVNLPAEITTAGGVTRLAFRDGGMMQVVLSGTARVLSTGWDVRQEGNKTVLTKYGPAETLELQFLRR